MTTPRRLAQRETVSAPNQLWQMDVKYGYIAGTDQFFFQLSLIDVFDRTARALHPRRAGLRQPDRERIDVFDRTARALHLGLSCSAEDTFRVLKNSPKAWGLAKGMTMPKLRIDNGQKFLAKRFEKTCLALGVVHERTPVKTPSLNAYIEAFHATLEWECYRRHEFESFVRAYRGITRYMEYYNRRRRHGSLGYMAPEEYYRAFVSNQMKARSFVA